MLQLDYTQEWIIVKYLRDTWDTFKKQAWLKDANSSGMVSVRTDASLKIAE